MMKLNILNLAYLTCFFFITSSCNKETPFVGTTGLTLSETSLIINVGSNDTLIANVSPLNATIQGVIWISSDSTIAKVNPSGIVTGVAPGVATIIAITNDGTITETCVVNSIKWKNYTTYDGLAANYVTCIAIDTHENLWFGGSSLSKFDGTDWTSYFINKGVFAITVDATGVIWFGTNGLGVFKFDGTNWTTYTTDNSGLKDNSITPNAIATDSQGIIWFGTSSRITWRGTGVSKFDGTNWLTYNSSDGLVYDNILSIAIDAKGNNWFVTSKGISKFDGKTWTSYTSANTNNELVDYANSIAIDGLGNKWFGTSLGVLKFDDTNWITYNTSNSGLVNNSIHAVAIDSYGNKWFGTSRGVSKFDNINWITYNYYNGLVNNAVLSIAIDARGHKWFGTAIGVSELQD